MKNYTEAEVKYLLKKQRELSVMALNISSFYLDFDVTKLIHIILDSELINFEENLKQNET